MEVLSLFTIISGYIIGLGAVVVIDLHGFLARKSGYWTAATITTHKITKPLIWIGMTLVVVGGFLFYREQGVLDETFVFWVLFWTLLEVLILNGLFLTFWVSPRLLKREKEGRKKEILPQSWQNAITVSFIVSFVGWWGSLFLFVNYLMQHYFSCLRFPI